VCPMPKQKEHLRSQLYALCPPTTFGTPRP
jgi:hypothetical protein